MTTHKGSGPPIICFTTRAVRNNRSPSPILRATRNTSDATFCVAPPKRLMQHFIGGEQLAPKEQGQQEIDDQAAADQHAESQLQEPQVTARARIQRGRRAVGSAKARPGHAQKRRRARLRGDDRSENGPPGQIPTAQQVAGHVALASPDPDAEQHDADQVDEQDHEHRPAQWRNRMSCPIPWLPTACGQWETTM